jgi:hypothetical protein
LFFLGAVVASTQSTGLLVAPTTLADITGTGAAVQVTASGTARWVLFMPLVTNSAVVRVGDINVGGSRGAPVAAGGGLLYPVLSTQAGDPKQPLYNLASIYVYIANGDKISIQWAN